MSEMLTCYMFILEAVWLCLNILTHQKKHQICPNDQKLINTLSGFSVSITNLTSPLWTVLFNAVLQVHANCWLHPILVQSGQQSSRSISIKAWVWSLSCLLHIRLALSLASLSVCFFILHFSACWGCRICELHWTKPGADISPGNLAKP